MSFKRNIARRYDLSNAFRVLDIMDKAGGVDIQPAMNIAGQSFEGYYDIKIKHWLSEEDAKDLQRITLFKIPCKERKGLLRWLFRIVFRTFRDDARVLQTMVK